MKKFYIDDKKINSFTKKELNKIVVCFNDGQGDHCVYTYNKIVKLLKESDIKINNLYVEGIEIVDNMKPSEIMNMFYNELDLDGNNTDALYFDKGKYNIIQWVTNN